MRKLIVAVAVSALVFAGAATGGGGRPWERLAALEDAVEDLVSADEETARRVDLLENRLLVTETLVGRLNQRLVCVELKVEWMRRGLRRPLPDVCR